MGDGKFLVPREEENFLVLCLCVLYRVESAANRVSIPDCKHDVAVVHHPLVTGSVATGLVLLECDIVHFRIVVILLLHRMKLTLIRPSTDKRNIFFISDLSKNLVCTPSHARDAITRLQFLDLLRQPVLDFLFPARYSLWPVARYHYLHHCSSLLFSALLQVLVPWCRRKFGLHS